ncbi:MAG: YceI family protein [Chloroflexi bacterium]|nr:YceI family protein [Chloroflexota bacterium]
MTTKRIVAVVAIVAVIVLAFLAYSFFKTPEEASAPIEAVPIAVEQQESAAEPTATPLPPEPTEVPVSEAEATVEAVAETDAPAESSAKPADSPLPTPEPVEEAEEAPELAKQEAEPSSSAPAIFEIVQEESEARFIIKEVLRGDDKTVIGITDQVSGQIAIDPAKPANSQVGTILVNARTLETDSNFRNRAVKNRILLTNDFEFVSFEPTEVIGLAESAGIGEPIDFQIAGNLTVTDETHPVVFDVIVTPVSSDRIEGLATVTILYKDFGLFIPDAEAVDTVEDEVTLQLEFVAIPK